ncbi:hypothetical protein [Streptomyces sp. CBMA156]|uniref:hypothetical protein n=1 Tax=Streptomyces sp. CBMA156 TaxID=1930280 RepID=UPI001661F60B|nr:hypothetical protein [Streptomyces sp. CBMA156]MBD0670053.1 hypothetical protein [Streptomyces sp. CBMA156]
MNRCDDDPKCRANEEITLLAHVRRDEAGQLHLHQLNPRDVQSVEHDVDEDHAHGVTSTLEQHERMLPELEALAKRVMEKLNSGTATRRLDIVIDREVDSSTYLHVFRGGYEVSEHGYSVHMIDPGAGDTDHAWYENLISNSADAPEKVRDRIREIAGEYHDEDGDCDECDPGSAETAEEIARLSAVRRADGRFFYNGQVATVIDRITGEPVDVGETLTRVGRDIRKPVVFKGVYFNEATGEHANMAICHATSPISGAVTEQRWSLDMVGLAFRYPDGRIYDVAATSYSIMIDEEKFEPGLLRTDQETGREVRILHPSSLGEVNVRYLDNDEQFCTRNAARFGITLQPWSVDIELGRA